MIVVADTTPLNYLVLIDVVSVLEPLYGQVIVPATVAEELNRPDSPPAVRSWIGNPPAWLEIRPDPPSDPALDFLDAGERAALALAVELRADELLIDERTGRAEALRPALTCNRNLRCAG